MLSHSSEQLRHVQCPELLWSCRLVGMLQTNRFVILKHTVSQSGIMRIAQPLQRQMGDSNRGEAKSKVAG